MNSSQIKNLIPARIETNMKPILISGISKIYYSGEVLNGFAQWEKFIPYLGNIAGQIGNVAYGLCLHHENGKGIEYMCGVEIFGKKDLPEEFVLKEIPGRSFAVFTHEDHVFTLRQTLDSIAKWLPNSSYEKPEGLDFFFERYGENFDSQTGKGDIEIWIPIKA